MLLLVLLACTGDKPHDSSPPATTDDTGVVDTGGQDSAPCDASDWYADGDGDGYGDAATTQTACDAPEGYVADASDCDDTDATVNPDGVETCDGVDQDCNDVVDDDASDQTLWYLDGDSDGYGNPGQSVFACDVPDGYGTDATDCNDARADVHPDATETDCADPVDYNCDGSTGYSDADADGSAACEDCDDADPRRSPALTEVCDAADRDEDCDGLSDDDDTSVSAASLTAWYPDGDTDGYGAGVAIASCEAPAGYVADDTDCDDAADAIHPGATEICDIYGDDEDCDGAVDDGDRSVDTSTYTTWHGDADSDGYGGTSSTTSRCDAPAGYVASATDCNDRDATINPAGSEICDAGSGDEDCDGLVDDADPSVNTSTMTTFYVDGDGDGYGSTTAGATACDAAAGYAGNSTDCDDANAARSPGRTEVCDGSTDEDCDGLVDDADASVTGTTTWYADDDVDGYGDPATGASVCVAPTGWVTDATDCDDDHSSVSPAGTEVCGGLDDDCDGLVDDDDPSRSGGNVYYADNDVDGYGNETDTALACSAPIGFISDDHDCDDASASIHPGAAEVCSDGVDDDCSGVADDSCPLSGDLDADGSLTDMDGLVYGLSTGSAYGASVAAGFDFDGDGHADDFAVGNASYSAGTYTGGAWVYDAAPSGTQAADAADVAYVRNASGSSSVFGEKVWGIPDLDADGRDELAVSYDTAVWLFAGADLGSTVELADAIDAEDGTVVSGVGAFGMTTDVEWAAADTTGSGAVTVYDGTTVDATLTGIASGDLAGIGLAGGADLDGDGQSDVVVGASGVSSGTGAVYVVLGPVSGTVSLADADLVLTDPDPSAAFGTAVATPGDFNGDGHEDLAAGAPGDAGGGTRAGAIFLFTHVNPGLTSPDATTADAVAEIDGDLAGDRLGTGAFAFGDVDGDGMLDAFVGSDQWSGGDGAAWLVYGLLRGTFDLGVDADARFFGGSADTCGASVQVVDEDADGKADLFLGCQDGTAGTSSGVGTVAYYAGR